MMYVQYRHFDGTLRTIEWHVNDPVNDVRMVASEVENIYADMDELRVILRDFCNLPVYNRENRFAQFYGDIAKGIAGNL